MGINPTSKTEYVVIIPTSSYTQQESDTDQQSVNRLTTQPRTKTIAKHPDMNQNAYNMTQAALVKAVIMLCRPLVRLLIEKGMTFPQFRDLIKELYVDVASKQFSLDDKTPSDSRIFVLTGVHRKDIKRLREKIDQENPVINSSASLSGEIIARWSSMPEYLDNKEKPRQLTKNSMNNIPGFEQLVSSVSKDVRPRVILEEWLRLNIVRLKDDNIILNKSAFVTNKEFKEMAYYFGHHIHDHMASCINNILCEQSPMLERSVYYASLSESSVKKLRTIADKKGNELLQHLNKQAIKFHDMDKHKDDANFRMRLGVYWYQAELNDDRESEK